MLLVGHISTPVPYNYFCPTFDRARARFLSRLEIFTKEGVTFPDSWVRTSITNSQEARK